VVFCSEPACVLGGFGGYRPRVGGGLTSGFERACKRVGIKDKDVTQL